MTDNLEGQNGINVHGIDELFALQHEPNNLQRLKESTASDRIRKITRMAAYLNDKRNENDWIAALEEDLGKSGSEAIITELSPFLANVKHVKRHLRSWMSDTKVDAPPVMLGLHSYIKPEPKGHVLIMAPWNYPLLLVLNPLIYAIAAGNAIMIKPSEYAPATASFLAKMIQSVFDRSEVAVIQGGQEEASQLLKKPFNHIFFTGSSRVGKIVMHAAAENLASVTLEMGGKSPVVIDRGVNMKRVAEKIAWAKCINAGQTCIAPDYAVIHRDDVREFIDAFQRAIDRLYKTNGNSVATSDDYGKIVTTDQFLRLKGLIDDAVQRGAKIEIEGEMNMDERLISPFVLTGVNGDMKLMQEEIFGPILPVFTYESFKEVPQLVNQWPQPLAIYVMSNAKKNIDFLMRNTVSGGVGINELLVTIVNPALPFGGINQSGIGKTHGRHGFIEFSNERGVVKRKWLDFRMIYPPVNKMIVRWLVKLSRL